MMRVYGIVTSVMLMFQHLALRGQGVDVNVEIPIQSGLEVSRPLQPVVAQTKNEEPKPFDEKAVESPASEQKDQSGNWSTYEMLLWWAKPQKIPEIVTGSRGSSSSALGLPNTVLLIGKRSIDESSHAGFHFTIGDTFVNSDLAFEFGGLFLGTNEARATIINNFDGRLTALGRPFRNSLTNMEDSLIIASPAVGPGGIQVATTTRVQGWEANFYYPICKEDDRNILFMSGYRYFGDYEGLHVVQTSLRFATSMTPETLWNTVDQIDARNTFHGGQIGVRAQQTRGPLSLSVAGNVAFGTNFEIKRIEGRSTATTVNGTQTYNAGFLGNTASSGQSTHAAFAVLPEARVNLSLRILESTHLYFGYDLIYLSDAVRAAEQVDHTINPSYVPILGGSANMVFRADNHFVRSDFWVQAIVLGIDCRY